MNHREAIEAAATPARRDFVGVIYCASVNNEVRKCQREDEGGPRCAAWCMSDFGEAT